MYPGGKELRHYVKTASNPTLVEFMENHSNLVDSEELTLLQLMQVWRDRFIAMLKKYHPNLRSEGRVTCDINVWKKLKVCVSNDIRSILFQWLYILEEKKSEDLPAFLGEKQEQIDALKSSDSDDVCAALDKLSINLLEGYTDLTCLEKEVLKLSLSRIVDLVDADFESYFRQHIPARHFDSWSNLSTASQLGEQEEAKLRELCQDFAQRVQTSFRAARKHVLLKRAEFEEEGDENSLEAKAYELIDAVTTIAKQKNEDNLQEADYVAWVKRLVQVVFRRSPLKIAIGETAAAATKPIAEYNQSNYSGSTSSVFASSSSSFPLPSSSTRKTNYNGRKIDLKVTGDNDQELSFWEFKTNDASQATLQKQESKTLRLAQCLQKTLKSSFSVENDTLCVTWAGWSGTVCRLYQQDGYCVAKRELDISIPNDERLIGVHLENAILALFELKEWLLSLNDEVFVQSSIRQRKRKSYEGMPHTLLSPKHV
ncbi:hypothetical protein A0J61_08244 [Choanephora cucurbitarum]|uniref:Uncharacterized protein n=1 Tax=Choanephora cucurbitarum TaxID=101091 RepID=A0A1C7N3R7_9FUNG|nr:hypothetical protein A0J61_08244 [Choanephora cucurbitarum]